MPLKRAQSGTASIIFLLVGLGLLTIFAFLALNRSNKQISQVEEAIKKVQEFKQGQLDSFITPSPESTNPDTSITPTIANTNKIVKYVALVTLDPKDENGIGVIAEYGWKNPEDLSSQYINTIKNISGGLVNYEISKRISYDKFPQKKNGFTLDHNYYQQCLVSADTNCREIINYGKFFEELNLCQEIADGKINEIWAFNGPWFGFWEWSVRGPTVNSLQENLPLCGGKTYAIMGFSYEKHLSEMLEDLGHRFESVLIKIPTVQNEWINFIKHEACGTVHIPPNGVRDYDWSNSSSASSSCDDYLNYPSLSGENTTISCSTWGCTSEGYLKWWLSHIPQKWWSFVIDTDNTL